MAYSARNLDSDIPVHVDTPVPGGTPAHSDTPVVHLVLSLRAVARLMACYFSVRQAVHVGVLPSLSADQIVAYVLASANDEAPCLPF